MGAAFAEAKDVTTGATTGAVGRGAARRRSRRDGLRPTGIPGIGRVCGEALSRRLRGGVIAHTVIERGCATIVPVRKQRGQVPLGTSHKAFLTLPSTAKEEPDPWMMI